MAKLPPAKKLSLAVRKEVREDYESKKPDLEKKLSEILGQDWKVDVDPLALWPYAELMGGRGFGTTLQFYINGAIFRLERYAESYGDEGLEELNRVAHAHTVTIDLDETVPESKAFAYCGFDIKEGQIRLLFAASAFGSNGDQCLDPDKLVTILNDAPDESDAQLSFTARTSIGKGWTPKIEAIRAKLSAVVGNPDIKFVPNFEDTFAKLSTESKRKGTELTKEWEERLGGFTYNYFETLVNLMPGGSDDFENDEMLKEGFNDAVDSNEIAFRIVDKLVGQNSSRQYCESQVEGGVLYLQTTAAKWGSNPNETYATLLEQL